MSDPVDGERGDHDDGHDDGHDERGADPGADQGHGQVHGAETCGEKAGFLFSHRCRRPSVGRCSRCSRPVCPQHRLDSDDAAMCVTCGRKQRKKRGSEREDHDDNPYFYSSYYYSGFGYYGPGSWGHHYYGDAGVDAADFSEADGASLASDSDGGDDDFEHDMGAS